MIDFIHTHTQPTQLSIYMHGERHQNIRSMDIDSDTEKAILKYKTESVRTIESQIYSRKDKYANLHTFKPASSKPGKGMSFTTHHSLNILKEYTLA